MICLEDRSRRLVIHPDLETNDFVATDSIAEFQADLRRTLVEHVKDSTFDVGEPAHIRASCNNEGIVSEGLS